MGNGVGNFGILSHILDGVSEETIQARVSMMKLMFGVKTGDIYFQSKKIGELKAGVSELAMNAVLGDVEYHPSEEILPEEFLDTRALLLRDTTRIDLDLGYKQDFLDPERMEFLLKKYGTRL